MTGYEYIIVQKEENDESDSFSKKFRVPYNDLEKLREARNIIQDVMDKNDIDLDFQLFSVAD